MDPQPVTLVGRHVRLEPLGPQHADDLWNAGRDESIWTWLTRGAFTSLQDVHDWIAATAEPRNNAPQMAFAIIDLAAGRAIGSTRYLDIRPADRTIEIGWTWLAPAAQRTAVNTECKFLLLRHAFETLGCLRVQLKTDSRNVRSQCAIERLGAVREGVLRKHMRTQGGINRDTVIYGITDDEWPAVKSRLLALLSQ